MFYSLDRFARAVSLACVSFASIATAAQAQTYPGTLAQVQIGTAPGRAIPPTFMGLSHEWGDAQRMMGDSQTGVNPIYRQLIANLAGYGSGPIILRIGGNSTDAQMTAPTPTRALPFAEVANALGAHFILGVNLGSGRTDLAVTQTKAYLSQMPPGSVDAIEIGNEADLYRKNGKRTASYGAQNYIPEFDQWKSSILPLLPRGVKLAGPSWASMDMLQQVQSFEGREAGALGIFTQHFYLTAPEAKPSDDILLKPKSATLGPSLVAAAAAASNANGIQFRLDEFNSVDDEGIHGLSDAFGAALWSVDTMFEYVKVGVGGVNWEASNGNFDNPFYFTNTPVNGRSSYSIKSINPLYYGLLLFQAATGKQARMLPVTLNTQANLKAWATIDSTGTPRLVLINKDKSQSGSVSVAMPGYSRASLIRLLAPSYTSTSGVTFGGQTLDGSREGMPHGTPKSEGFNGSNGVFQIPMPVTSAALVVFYP